MNEMEAQVNRHYGWSGLMETIEQEIRRNGIDPARVTVDELAPVDNYHWHRLAGTLALARAAQIGAADSVLDVGGGIGGPARQLAQRYGCRVTVLDLTAGYFLLTPEETRTLIEQSGFREITWLTDEALEAELERPDPQAPEPSSHPPLTPVC